MYMIVSRHQNTRQDHDVMIANKSFENVLKQKYLKKTVLYENWT
jgi:hypothetical protein